MNVVPMEPMTVVRRGGIAVRQISALKPGGSLALPPGILSSVVAVAGCGSFKFRFWLLLA